MISLFSPHFILIILISIYLSFPDHIDLEDSKYNGAVKSITEFKFKARIKNKRIIRKKHWIERKFLVLNRQGDKTRYVISRPTFPVLIETFTYDTNGFLVEELSEQRFAGYTNKYVYRNDSHGNRIETIEMDKNNVIDDRTIYHYDNQNRLIELIEYDNDGDVDDHYTDYIYDKFDNWIERTSVDGNEKEKERRAFKYDNRGNIIEKIEYETDNTIDDRYVYTYNSKNQLLTELDYDENGLDFKNVYLYDKEGNLTKHTEYYSDDKIRVKFFGFKYDSQGNWIVSYKMDEDKDYYVFQRVFVYYNTE